MENISNIVTQREIALSGTSDFAWNKISIMSLILHEYGEIPEM
jgi:hypothetical protein